MKAVFGYKAIKSGAGVRLVPTDIRKHDPKAAKAAIEEIWNQAKKIRRKCPMCGKRITK